MHFWVGCPLDPDSLSVLVWSLCLLPFLQCSSHGVLWGCQSVQGQGPEREPSHGSQAGPRVGRHPYVTPLTRDPSLPLVDSPLGLRKLEKELSLGGVGVREELSSPSAATPPQPGTSGLPGPSNSMQLGSSVWAQASMPTPASPLNPDLTLLLQPRPSSLTIPAA